MKVPLLDLKAQYATFKEEAVKVINKVCDDQWFIKGPEVQALEEEIAEYSHTSHAVGCASGSDALLLALMHAGINAGDEVITSPFTFFATAGSIARLDAKPVFVDIQADTYNIDPEKIEAAITPKTKAVMPVHLYGQCADMEPIVEICKKHNLVLIEDAAQAIGSEYQGKRAGSIGDYGCFSFFPSKNLGCFGDGGMISVNGEDKADELKVIREHGGKPKYFHRLIGINSRLDALQAAILRVKLKHLDAWSEGRQVNAEKYCKLFEEAGLLDKITLPVTRPGNRHIYNQFVIRVPERDKLRQHLVDNGIGCEIYYPVPLHLQECFSYLGMKKGHCPVSEKAADEVIALPVYPELTDEQQKYVVDTIKDFINII